MARAISSFGLYLGSMEPRIHGDCRSWSVFLATDDLAFVPHQLEFRIGGIVYTASIHPRKWFQGQIYQRSDLPQSSFAFQPPPPLEPEGAQLASKVPSAVNPMWFQGDEVTHFSLKALREIFKDCDLSDLPPDFAECLAGNVQAITAHNTAGKVWEQQLIEQGTHIGYTPDNATKDPPQNATSPRSSQQPRSQPTRPTSQASQPVVHDANPTVHRTDASVSRGKRLRDDLAVQVCPSHPSLTLGLDQISWDPRDLFPEICSPTIHQDEHQTDRLNSTKPAQSAQAPTNKNFPNPKPASMAKSRVGKKKKGGETLIDLEVDSFVDVPLQHAEGVEILALIGASSIPIPSHIMLPPQRPRPNLEVGQSSKAAKKKIKATTQQLRELPDTQPQAQVDSPLGLTHDATAEHNNANEELPKDNAALDDLDELADDRYLDRVDYSDDEPLL